MYGMKNFWNERYSQTEYVYGTAPNVFLANELQKLPAGKILFPCEGEGRNAVFAAEMAWEVEAFDSSEMGREKALSLAKSKNVRIKYQIQDANLIDFEENSFDVVALIYAHFPPTIRQTIHQKMIHFLKSGGNLILEGFNPHQLNNSSGGPKDLAMLYTQEMLAMDFADLKIEYLDYQIVELQEGDFHKGKADIIRLIATKN